ncbi:uncharacterized protein LOC133792259 [Humulus lupulus]|uniref:uncharacterized protein LOC133792259 n=1 Tax=Humulus lupulus TaxID=3486 RepID=UPI002B413DA0|nr:uncharacterized protein LOC133792259 [Humulus lupulus]
MVTPLTELLKKGVNWAWTDKCDEAFRCLKEAMIKDPILALPDVSKPFQVQTDALDYAVGGGAGRLNQAVDALSCKPELATLKILASLSISVVNTPIKDPVFRTMLKLVKEGVTHQFWVENDLLSAKGTACMFRKPEIFIRHS